jgi:hypothetical protein
MMSSHIDYLLKIWEYPLNLGIFWLEWIHLALEE